MSASYSAKCVSVAAEEQVPCVDLDSVFHAFPADARKNLYSDGQSLMM